MATTTTTIFKECKICDDNCYKNLEYCLDCYHDKFDTCWWCKLNEKGDNEYYCDDCEALKKKSCDNCWSNDLLVDKAGDWDYCYECMCEAFPICPRCFSKIYDSYCTSCYGDLTTCNICYEECDDLTSILICRDCIVNDNQKCIDYVMNIIQNY